jgi:CheY-like chemotaxis protein
MATDRERIRRLASEVAALRRELDEMRDRVATLRDRAEGLGASIVETSQAAAGVLDAAGGLSARIQAELRLSRASRNIVFVVDHEADALGVATGALSGAGYAVQGFPRAEELIAVLPLAVPRAVLIDLDAPGGLGTTLAEYLRTNPRTARVRRLGMTGFVPSAEHARPFASFIEKPLEPVALVDFVHHALAPVPTRASSRHR